MMVRYLVAASDYFKDAGSRLGFSNVEILEGKTQ